MGGEGWGGRKREKKATSREREKKVTSRGREKKERGMESENVQ